MKDKVCLITGANSGIGKITAIELAKKGAKIVMVCRNPQKAEEARKEIIEKSKNDSVDILLADFSSQKQIKAVAEEFKQKYDRLDVLLNNAGFIAGSKRETTEDGYETTFAVNHLGYFMLTNLLIDPLKATPSARVISVSSAAHYFSRLDLDNLQLEKGYSSIKAYALSKLCNILFARELAKRLAGTNITSNCLHPGGVATNFASDSTPFFKFLFSIGKPFLISAEKGAETSIYLSSSPEVANVSGEYFDKKRIKKTSSAASNQENMKQLWELSTEMTHLQGIAL